MESPHFTKGAAIAKADSINKNDFLKIDGFNRFKF